MSSSKSSRIVIFGSLGAVSYLHSIVTMAVSILFHFRVKTTLVKNRDFFIPSPPAFDALVIGVPVGILP